MRSSIALERPAAGEMRVVLMPFIHRRSSTIREADHDMVNLQTCVSTWIRRKIAEFNP
jgi:hypothetical protein